MNPSPRRLVGAIVPLMIAVGLAPALEGQGQGASAPTLKVVIRGQDTPELIPDFLAWKAFFEHVARSHRASGLKWLLTSQVDLKEVDKASLSQVSKAVLVCATVAVRELERHRFARQQVAEALQSGEFEEDQAVDLQFDSLRQEMASLKGEKDRLETLLAAHVDAWERIAKYVLTKEKSAMVLVHDNSPEDLEYLALLWQFEKKAKAKE